MRTNQSMLNHLLNLLMLLNWGRKFLTRYQVYEWLNVGDRPPLLQTMKLDGLCFEAFAWLDEENVRVLNKAPKIVCIDFLFRDEIFDIDVDWCHWLHVSLLLTKLFSIPELQRLEWRSQKKISNCNALVYHDWAWNATLFICI